MDHDVFMCCCEQDYPAADAIRDGLELRGVHCWFAPLDNPSESFSTLRKGKAIARSKTFALIFSTLTNLSRSAECETAFARKLGRPIVVIRLDAAIPRGRFPILLRGAQTVNAFGTPARDRYGEILALIVNAKPNVAMDAELPDWNFGEQFAELPGCANVPASPVQSPYSSVTAILRKTKSDPVLSPATRFTLAIPAPLTHGALHILLICAHLDDRRGAILQRARMIRANGYLKLMDDDLSEAERLLRVQVELRLPGFEVLDLTDDLLWGGSATTAGFGVRVPENKEHGIYEGQFVFKVAGIQIALMPFTARVGAEDIERGFAIFETRPYQSVFASYAADDDIAVLARVRDLQKAMPQLDVFLKSPAMGHTWQREELLAREIAGRDALYLFWSNAARANTSVEEEWRLALETIGPERIVPVPLVDARFAPPPRELMRLDFGRPSDPEPEGGWTRDYYYVRWVDEQGRTHVKVDGGKESNAPIPPSFGPREAVRAIEKLPDVLEMPDGFESIESGLL